jgi:uncharacterized protein (TIGR00730 family)
MVQESGKIEPQKKKICVYCGSRMGSDPRLRQVAIDTGQALVKHGYDMVFGGGSVGLMGILADTVMKEGGRVFGVIPKALFNKEVAHSGITELIEVTSMHERKAKMELLSDGFLILPGGFGTMDEFFEIVTWRQLGLHNKPVGVYNCFGFYDEMVKLMSAMLSAGFINAPDLSFIKVGVDMNLLMENFKKNGA